MTQTHITPDNHFAVLGIAPDAPADEIRRAYHKLSHQWHPDHHMQADEQRQRQAADMFKRVNQAYAALSVSLVGSARATVRQHAQTPSGMSAGDFSRGATLRERQLHMVAVAGTRARLMVVALRWDIRADIFRREVDVVRRLISDAIVWGEAAFPNGIGAAWSIYLSKENLQSEDAHVRTILAELLTILAEGIPGQVPVSHAEWIPILRLIDPLWPQSVMTRTNAQRATRTDSTTMAGQRTPPFGRDTHRAAKQTTTTNGGTTDQANRATRTVRFSEPTPVVRVRSQPIAAVFLLCGLAALISSAFTLLTERDYSAPTLTFVLLYGGLAAIIAAIIVDRAER